MIFGLVEPSRSFVGREIGAGGEGSGLGDGADLVMDLVGMGGGRVGMYMGTGTDVTAGEGMVGIALSAGVVSVDSDPAGSGSVEGAPSELGEGIVPIEGEEGTLGLGLRTTGVEGKRPGVATGVDAADATREEFRVGRAGKDGRPGEGSGETSSVPKGTRSVGVSRGAESLASWAKLFGGGVGGTVVARDMMEEFLDSRIAGRGLSSNGSTNGSSLFGC